MPRSVRESKTHHHRPLRRNPSPAARTGSALMPPTPPQEGTPPPPPVQAPTNHPEKPHSPYRDELRGTPLADDGPPPLLRFQGKATAKTPTTLPRSRPNKASASPTRNTSGLYPRISIKYSIRGRLLLIRACRQKHFTVRVQHRFISFSLIYFLFYYPFFLVHLIWRLSVVTGE